MTAPREFRRFGLVFCLLAGVASCRGGDPEAGRAEAGQLVHAIRLLRRAPHDQKQGPLEHLEKAACTSDRCETKERCIEAYRAHVRGTEKLGAARRALAGSDAPVSGSAANLLTGAQEELEQSVALAKECADLEAELTRRYKLE